MFGWTYRSPFGLLFVLLVAAGCGSDSEASDSGASDSEVSECPIGTFGSDADDTECEPWTTCVPGTYVEMEGGSTVDRLCAQCEAGTFTADDNQPTCMPLDGCSPGTAEVTPGSDMMESICEACTPGEYCAGGEAPAVPCDAGGDGTWDDDMDPSTECTSRSECMPGTMVMEEGDATTDRTCTPTLCAENEFVEANECVPCPVGATNDANDDASGDDTVCDDACSLVFGVTCNNVEEHYLKASNTGGGDEFGRAVALSGNTLVVGADKEAGAATGVNGAQSSETVRNSGAAYVFTRSGTTWSQQAYLKASNTGRIDAFGFSVAISGDTIAVGAIGEGSAATGVNGDETDDTAQSSGAVYVFTRSGTTWSQQAYIKASNTEAFDAFGISVALSGDTLAVGARGEDSSATGVEGDQNADTVPSSESGAVYVFTRTGSTWSQEAYLKASNTSRNGLFGAAVALSEDTLAVGAFSENSGATGVNGDQTGSGAPGSGAAYVFTRTGTTWSQQAYLKASNTGDAYEFGFSIALSGDTLAVGSPGESSAATGIDGNQSDTSFAGAGAVYVFTRTGTTWSQQAYIKASNTGQADYFGFSVALLGDTLAVGARREYGAATNVNGDQMSNAAPESGAAYTFTRTGGTWSQQAYIKASNTESEDEFGYSVTLSEDLLAVGARFEDSAATDVNGDQTSNAATDSGAAYVRRIAP